MAGPIKLFQFIQKCHQTIGISPFRPNQKQRLTNLIQTILLISLAQFMLTTAAFALFDAKSMFEYGFAFYSFVTMINCIAIYLILIWQSQNTLEFIKSGEAFIAKSKCLNCKKILRNSRLSNCFWRKMKIKKNIQRTSQSNHFRCFFCTVCIYEISLLLSSLSLLCSFYRNPFSGCIQWFHWKTWAVQ